MFRWSIERYGKKRVILTLFSLINIILILGVVWSAIVSSFLPFNSFENNTAIIDLTVMYKKNPFFYLTILSSCIFMFIQIYYTGPMFLRSEINFFEFMLFVLLGGVGMLIYILTFSIVKFVLNIFNPKISASLSIALKGISRVSIGKNILYPLVFTSIIIPIPITLLAQNPLDKMSPDYKVTLSLDPSKPNTIFLFLDSLSSIDIDSSISDSEEDKVFENFVSFENTVTSGISTYISFNSMTMGEDWLWGAAKESDVSAKTAKSQIFDWVAPEENNRFFVNPMSFLGDDYANNFTNLVSGDWEYAEKTLDNDISVVNWSRARYSAIQNGVRGKSHYYNNVQYPVNNYEIGEPSTTFIYDESLHYPFLTSSTGGQTPFGTLESNFQGTFHALDSLFNGLKSISNDVTNAFDNSKIIITTDHASHHLDSPTQNDAGERFLGKVYMKFPGFEGGLSRIEENVLWTPHVRNIVEGYQNNIFTTQDEMVSWVESNNNFSPDRLSYVGIGNNTFHGTDGSAMFVTKDNQGNFNHSKIDWLENEIFNVSDAQHHYPGRVLEEVRWKD